MKKSKEILLAAVGKTPQIITETLYYYTHPYYENQRTFDQIKLLVTKNSKERTIELLFESGILDKMCDDLNISRDSLKLSEKDVLFIKDAEGGNLEDIRDSKACTKEP